MCGRIAQFGPFSEIVALINIWSDPATVEESVPRYNSQGAPTECRG